MLLAPARIVREHFGFDETHDRVAKHFEVIVHPGNDVWVHAHVFNSGSRVAKFRRPSDRMFAIPTRLHRDETLTCHEWHRDRCRDRRAHSRCMARTCHDRSDATSRRADARRSARGCATISLTRGSRVGARQRGCRRCQSDTEFRHAPPSMRMPTPSVSRARSGASEHVVLAGLAVNVRRAPRP